MRMQALPGGMPRDGAAGFTIVEVLVALVVLSVGMLGIAGLYVITLQSGGTAIYRTQAVNLASDMADRIRANRNAGVAYQNGASGALTCVGAGAVDCLPAIWLPTTCCSGIPSWPPRCRAAPARLPWRARLRRSPIRSR